MLSGEFFESADSLPGSSLIIGMICFGRYFVTQVFASAIGRPCLQLSAPPSSPQRRMLVWPSFFHCIWKLTSLPLKPSAKVPVRNTAWKGHGAHGCWMGGDGVHPPALSWNWNLYSVLIGWDPNAAGWPYCQDPDHEGLTIHQAIWGRDTVRDECLCIFLLSIV